MAVCGVSAENEVFEVTAFEVPKFVRFKVTVMQSFSDVTIKMCFRWLFSTQ